MVTSNLTEDTPPPRSSTNFGHSPGFTKRDLINAMNRGIDEELLQPEKPLWRGADRNLKRGLAPAEWTPPKDDEGVVH